MADQNSKLKTADLDELLAGREKARADRNFNAIQQFNKELSERFDYTDPTPPADLPIADQEEGLLWCTV